MKKRSINNVQLGPLDKEALLNAAEMQKVECGIAMCMDVLGLCGYTLASLAATRKDMKQLIDSIKRHNVKTTDIISVLFDVAGVIPFTPISTLAGLASFAMHLVQFRIASYKINEYHSLL